jgi:16S rRNA (adenine1518-N6/adenine1519-N6)-dimethyltransferase
VLEIGPGLGTLTKFLLNQAKSVIAVEFDPVLAQSLPKTISEDGPLNGEITVVQEDILSFDFASAPHPYKVVANIPYYLTSNLIRVLSESTNPPTGAVILIQKEVAERVCAKPGQMSILSVTAQYYWQVSLGRVVEAELFTPPPKVDSQILIMKYRPRPLFEDVDTKRFFRLVKAGFGQKRKTLENALSGGLAISKGQAKAKLRLCSNRQILLLGLVHRHYHSMIGIDCTKLAVGLERSERIIALTNDMSDRDMTGQQWQQLRRYFSMYQRPGRFSLCNIPSRYFLSLR